MTTDRENVNIDIPIEDISIAEIKDRLSDWGHYLKRFWLIILIVSLLGGVLGFVYSFLKKSTYIATSTFVLDEGTGGSGILGSLGGIAAMTGLDLGSQSAGLFQGDNMIELYKSRSMIQKALLSSVTINGKKELLVNRYILANGLTDKWNDPNLFNLSFSNSDLENRSRVKDSLLGEFVKEINKNNLVVEKQDKKLSIIKVDVSSTDEFFSKAFNDQIVMTVNDFYLETRTKKSLQNVNILQSKTDSVRSVMNGSIYTAAEVLDYTPNLNPTRQVQRVAPVQKAQFSLETNKVILAELVKNLEITKMGLLKETPLIQMVDSPIFPLDKQELGKTKASVTGFIIFGFLMIIILVLKRSVLG